MIFELNYKPPGAVALQFHNSRAFVRVIRGPLGSGKTFAVCAEIFDLMCCQTPDQNNIRRSRWAAVRNTYPDLKGTTIKDWMTVTGEEVGKLKQDVPPTHYLDFMLEDGSRVLAEMVFIAFDIPKHVRKARGLQLTGVWFNEMKELDKAVVDMMIGRTGRYPSESEVPGYRHGAVGDTNAPDDSHWLYQYAEEKPEGVDLSEWEFFHQPGGVIEVDGKWLVNPAAENRENLKPDYYLKQLSGKKDDWIRVNLANEYGLVMDGKPVHPEYVDSVHCAGEVIPFDPNFPLFLGLDFGRTPAAALFQQVGMGRFVVIDEFVTDDFSAAQFAPELKAYINANYPTGTLGRSRGWGDPSGDNRGQATDDTPIRIMNAHGFNIEPFFTNNPLVRRSAVSNPLRRNCMDGRPSLIVSPKAKIIRKGLRGGFCYRRVNVAGERYTEIPDKNEFSHVIEGLEYGLGGCGEGKLAINDVPKPKQKARPVVVRRKTGVVI